MTRTLICVTMLLGGLIVSPAASADPWKDESGHGKHWKEDRGEPPWWERGKGYWDGHFKHGRWPPEYDRVPEFYLPPAPYYYPPPPPYHYWSAPDVDHPPAWRLDPPEPLPPMEYRPY